MEITITKKDNNHAEFIKAYLKLKCNFAKLYYKNEILRLEKEELEQQLGYECECNKQFVECQNLIEKILDIVKTNPNCTSCKDIYNLIKRFKNGN